MTLFLMKFTLKPFICLTLFLTSISVGSIARTQEVSKSIPAAQGSTPSQTELTKNDQYCVFFVIETKLLEVKVSKFSSHRLTHCGQEQYERLTAVSIAAQLQSFMRARQVLFAGVHTSLASRNISREIKPYIEIGSLSFRSTAEFKVSYFSVLKKYILNTTYGQEFNRSIVGSYVPVKVTGESHLVYDAGLRAYEITAPDGVVYLMTSYTNYFNRDINEDTLKDLGQSLNLPVGWSYRSRILDKEITVNATTLLPFGHAIFLADEYNNFYTRIQ